jgi:hypothetical protein
MPSTPVAYNPSRTPISGTQQVGDLAVGTSSQAYSTKPGGVVWWMSPDTASGYVISAPRADQPNPTSDTGTVRFWRSKAKTDQSFLDLANKLSKKFGGGVLADNAAAYSWLNTNGYWTTWTNGVTFSQSFVVSTAPLSTVETAWNTFRAALTGSYTQFVWSSTNGNSITVTDATKVQTLANNLRTATPGNVSINGVSWFVGTGCGSPKIGGVAVEFSNIASCNASSTYALRPMINNANWGGTNQSTVGAPSQTITLTFS